MENKSNLDLATNPPSEGTAMQSEDLEKRRKKCLPLLLLSFTARLQKARQVFR